MKPLTLAEAAEFLRMSRSSLYQRKDIPRYRRPGSTVYLFDQEELEAWLKQGRIGGSTETPSTLEADIPKAATLAASNVVEISSPTIYHRSARYR